MLGCRVEVVQRAGDQQVGVGVEVLAELVTLVPQVALDLELDVLRAVSEFGGAQCAAELLLHRIVGQVGDVADHARHAQAALGDQAVGVEVAAVEVGVGDDGAAGHLVEGDVLRRQVGRRGHGHAVAHALRVTQRPAQRLHAPQAAAQHGGQLRDAQAVQQACLRVHPVFHRHHGEVGAPDAARGRIDVHGPGGAEAGAEVVDANDEEAVGVQGLARAHQVVPPAFAARLARVGAGHMVAGVQGVAHQHRVGALGVERAVGLVVQRVVRQDGATLQRQGLAEVHLLRCDVADGTHARRARQARWKKNETTRKPEASAHKQAKPRGTFANLGTPCSADTGPRGVPRQRHL